MQINKDDYVIANIVDTKYLIKVNSVSKDTVVGIVATVASDRVEPITFFIDDIISNLGDKPRSGTTYGVKVEIFERYIDTFFGKIALFLKLEKKTRKELIKGYNKTYDIISDLGLLGFTYTLEHEIKDKSGKMAGCYFSSKNLDHNDKMTLFVNGLGAMPLEEVILHECGHGIWHRLIQQDHLKSKWAEDYSKFIEVESISEKTIKKHLAALISSGENFSTYKSSVKKENDELEILMVKTILDYFKKIRRLTIKDLDTIVMYDKDFLQTIWPTSEKISRIKENPISLYAMKNVHEYFSECFRLHAIGKKLPRTTRKLMEKTISISASVKGIK